MINISMLCWFSRLCEQGFIFGERMVNDFILVGYITINLRNSRKANLRNIVVAVDDCFDTGVVKNGFSLELFKSAVLFKHNNIPGVVDHFVRN